MKKNLPLVLNYFGLTQFRGGAGGFPPCKIDTFRAKPIFISNLQFMDFFVFLKANRCSVVRLCSFFCLKYQAQCTSTCFSAFFMVSGKLASVDTCTGCLKYKVDRPEELRGEGCVLFLSNVCESIGSPISLEILALPVMYRQS